MATEFNDATDYALFIRDSKTLTNGNGYAVRWSEIALAALRSAGVLDIMEDGTTAPAHDKLWLDKNTDPAILKEWDSISSTWQAMTFDRLFGRAIVTELTNVGGTANAITVDEPDNFIANRLYSITPTADNTGATTIQVTGVSTYNVKYHDGSAIDAGEFINGQNTVLLFANGRFEVLYPFAPVNAAQAAAEAAQAAAEAAAATIDYLVVADRAAMKAADTSAHTAVSLRDDGSRWLFKSGDFSAEVTADTAENFYAAATDTASTSGAWVRLFDEFPLPNYNANARARKMPDRLAEDGSVNVKEFAALGADCGTYDLTAGTGSEDTDAIQNAFDFAKSEGIRSIFFPRTKVGQGIANTNGQGYGISDSIVFDGDRWNIFGGGGYAGTELIAKANKPIFTIDCQTIQSEFGCIRNLGFRSEDGLATWDATSAIKTLVDPDAVGNANGLGWGISHWEFNHLRFCRLQYGIVVSTSYILTADDGNQGAGTNGFNRFTDLQVPLQLPTELPLAVVLISGPIGPHNSFSLGNYRTRPILSGGDAAYAGIVAGTAVGDGTNMLGDTRIVGINFNLGPQAVRLKGPSNTSIYNSEIVIEGCQSDNMDNYSWNLENLSDIKAHSNNTINQPHRLVNCANYDIRDQLHNLKHRTSPTDFDTYDASIDFAKVARIKGAYALGATAQTVTISGGVVSGVTNSRLKVATEASASSDDLDTITVPAGWIAGMQIIVQALTSGKNVNVKHGTGNILLGGGTDKALTSSNDRLVLELADGATTWIQKSISLNHA